MADAVHQDDDYGEKPRLLNLCPTVLIHDQDSSSVVSVHHQHDHNINICGSEKRVVLLNLFPIIDEDHSSSVSVHHQDKQVCGEKRLLNLFPTLDEEYSSSVDDDHHQEDQLLQDCGEKRVVLLNLFPSSTVDELDSSSSVVVDAPLAAKSVDFTYYNNNMPPKKRFMREEEEEDSSFGDIQASVRNSAFSLLPKQSLTSKEHSSVDTYTQVTGCLNNWQIKKRWTLVGSPKKTECLEADDHNKIRNLQPATDEEELKRFITGEDINGTDIRLVIQKKLFKSDLKRDQNRLSMPIKKLETNEFLTAGEKEILNDMANVTPAIEVGLVGPKLEMYKKPMRLSLWKMRRNKNYVLKTNWSDFMDDNKEYLEIDRVIRVWSFRKDEQLCFAISIM